MSFRQLFQHFRLSYNTDCRRFAHNEQYARVLVPLKTRALLKVSGKDAPTFLQGLITNDMRHLEDGAQSMFAMFLNNKGRVLYDTLIYKWGDGDSFLVECDLNIMHVLRKHLNIYKLKQKVDIEDTNKFLWALVSPVNCGVNEMKIDVKSPINMFKDPRLSELGCRIITLPHMTASHIVKFISHGARMEDEEVYKYLRYKYGVGEGTDELPPGNCFPLEMNGDYLHGVCFHKGCYIGQELTARVHHTGVVRKRLMPLVFDKPVTSILAKDAVIKSSTDPKSNLGKLKGYMHDHGLGLVRTKEAVEAKTLQIDDNLAQVIRPHWWPIEAPKEKIKLS